MRRLIYIMLVWALPATAQTPVTGTLDIVGRLNATQALSTAPAKLVSSLPSTCTQGQAVLLTTAPLTEWLHICTSTNTWTKQMQSSVAWSAITGKPVTFAPSVHSHLAVDLPATLLYSDGSYSNPGWLTSLAGSKVSGAVPMATALAANGANCPAGQAASGVDASGNAEGCFVPDGEGGAVGTVTSVGLSAPTQFSVLGSPITSSGSLSLGWANQNANTVLAGPAMGSPAAPTFRGLTAQDLPGTLLYSSGSYANPAWIASLDRTKVSGLDRLRGTVVTTLVDPTIREEALFDATTANRIRFRPPVLQEQSTDGVTWTASTRATTEQLATLVIGNGNLTTFGALPDPGAGNPAHYRLTWNFSDIYVFLNQLYIYGSTRGNIATVKVEVEHNTNGWEQIGLGTVNNWPGHIFLAHDAKGMSSSASQYGKARITFSVASALGNGTALDLQSIEWWGTYPAGRRDLFSTDRLRNVAFPAAITAVGDLTGLNLRARTAEIGVNQTGNRTAWVDLVGDDTYADYGMRMIRLNGGANTESQILHRGTGRLMLQTQEAAPITFDTAGVERMRVASNGRVGIGVTVPATVLDVNGDATIRGRLMTDNVRNRISQITDLPYGYPEFNPLNFRFDDSATAYAGEWGTVTFTGGTSPTNQQLKNLFAYNPSYINLNSFKDANNRVVIELSGINVLNSHATNWNPYVFCHSSCTNVTTMKLEIKNGADAWMTVYDGASSDYVSHTTWFATASTAGLKGARWTFSGIVGAAYLKMLGVRGVTEPDYKWTLLRNGGDLYGDVRILDGTTPKISLTKATGTVTATSFVGALSGNASTASALAANGANCPAGQVPLGVDASGEAEGCYDPNTYRAQQINFGFGGDPATVIPNTTFNNIWRAHAHAASVTEVACWTDAGTVSLTIRRSDGTNMHSALTCSTTGASTATITTPGVALGQGLGFVTASAATVKNLSVSIRFVRSY